MKQRLRARCPICGMIADVERFEEKIYPIQVFLQTFGGKIKANTVIRGRGKSPGFIEYKEITSLPEAQKIVKTIRRKLKSRISH